MTQNAETSGAPARQKTVAVPPYLLTAGCVLLFAAVSAYVFRGAWNPLNTIEGADASLWLPKFVQEWTKWLFVPRWYPHFLAGIAQQFAFLSHGLPLMLTLPPHRFHGFEFMLDTFLAGAFMFAFLRDQRIGRFGSLVGGLSFQLGNGLLTGARQGVLWKFDTACWVPLFLLFFTRILDDKPGRVRNCVFAGAALGLQFLGGEIQLAYYVCLLALAYFAVDSAGALWSARRAEPLSGPLKAVGKRSLWAALAAVVGIVFASEVFCSYISYARQNENVGVQSDAENWRFATEFSFPPEETVSLALTGRIFGDNLHSERYMGRQLTRITDDYIGIVVILFAFISLLSGKRRTYFFACAAVVALIISFGRYFPPPYRLIYALPAMKGLRNPHKWLFITALCVPILAGMGADYWKNAPPSRNRRIVAAIILFFALMFGLAYLTPAIVGDASGGVHLPSAVRRPMVALILAALICIVGRTAKAKASSVARVALPAFVIILLAGDLIMNASKFILYYNYRDKYVKDEVAEWLREKAGPFRVKLWSESPYLRSVMTEVLPFYGMDVVDAIMSRRPPRYSDAFQAAREGRLPYEKLFQLFNVKYILSAAAMQGADVSVRPVATFGSNSDAATPRDCYIYALNDFLPRVYVVGKFAVSEPDGVIDPIGRPDFDLRRVVMLEKPPAVAIDAEAEEPTWSVEDFSRSPHRVSARVTVDRQAILVLQDFYDGDWHAYVDQQEVEMLRANYLMRAIVVPEGTHSVLFKYKPAVWGYALTLAGWVCLAALVLVEGARVALRRGRRRDVETG